jgi:hypothetical protein
LKMRMQLLLNGWMMMMMMWIAKVIMWIEWDSLCLWLSSALLGQRRWWGRLWEQIAVVMVIDEGMMIVDADTVVLTLLALGILKMVLLELLLLQNFQPG